MTIVNVLLAIILLGFIIMVHELGHYTVGRLCGIGIEEFSIGFGPRLLGWERKGIRYSLRAIPLGGYVHFTGEDGDEAGNAAHTKKMFHEHPVWKRILTVFAGAGMNFVLAFVAIVIYLSLWGQNLPVLSDIQPDSPAMEAGLQAGDVVVSVDGTPIDYNQSGFNAMYDMFSARNDGTPFTLGIQRGGERMDVTIAKAQTEEGAWQLGVILGAVGGIPFGPALKESAYIFGRMSTMLLDALRNLIFHGEGADQIAGTVGAVNLVSQNITQGFDRILDMLAAISLNLGIMNLLPLPALDGGRLVFLLIEAIRRKPVPPEKEGLVHMIGMVGLLVLMVVLTYSDIMKMIH